MNTAVFILTLISLSAATPGHRLSVRPGLSAGRAVEQRVWSNDDVKYLRENAPISVVGVTVRSLPTAPTEELPSCEAPYVREDDPLWYYEEIADRREQIAQIDWQLAHVAAAEESGQGISNAFPLVGTNPGILLPGTVFSLQQQQEELRLEIADLQDLAHSREIPRAAWR